MGLCKAGCVKQVVLPAKDKFIAKMSEAKDSYAVPAYNNLKDKLQAWYDGLGNLVDKDALEKVKTQYQNWGEKIKEKLTPDNSSSQNNESWREQAEQWNYIVFKVASMVYPVLSYIPTILSETGVSVMKEQIAGSTDFGLMSIQKIMNIAQSSEIPNIVSGIGDLYNKHSKLFKEIKGKHINDVLKILLTPESNQLDGSLKQIKSNIEALKNETSIDSLDKLLKFIFLGKDHSNTLKSSVTQLKTKVDDSTVETMLKGAGLEDSLINTLKSVMGTLNTQLNQPSN